MKKVGDFINIESESLVEYGFQIPRRYYKAWEGNMIKIAIYGANNKLIFHDNIMRINLPELLIIKKSTEWFRDSTPCFLHKSAVMKRIFLEMEDYFVNQNKGIYYDEIPEVIREMLSNYFDIHHIEI